jgi:hypothetical protein
MLLLDAKWKWMRLTGAVFLSGALMVCWSGCADVEETSATPVAESETPSGMLESATDVPGEPTPVMTPEPTYQPLSLGFGQIWVSCVYATDEWYYALNTLGWAADYPYLIAYEDYEWYGNGTDPYDPDIWTEKVVFDSLLDQGYDEIRGGYYQVWEEGYLEPAGSVDTYIPNVTTLLRCTNLSEYTFVVNAVDYWTGEEVCTALGKHADVYGMDQGCLWYL